MYHCVVLERSYNTSMFWKCYVFEVELFPYFITKSITLLEKVGVRKETVEIQLHTFMLMFKSNLSSRTAVQVTTNHLVLTTVEMND